MKNNRFYIELQTIISKNKADGFTYYDINNNQSSRLFTKMFDDVLYIRLFRSDAKYYSYDTARYLTSKTEPERNTELFNIISQLLLATRILKDDTRNIISELEKYSKNVL